MSTIFGHWNFTELALGKVEVQLKQAKIIKNKRQLKNRTIPEDLILNRWESSYFMQILRASLHN